jgi:hypothetical protein
MIWTIAFALLYMTILLHQQYVLFTEQTMPSELFIFFIKCACLLMVCLGLGLINVSLNKHFAWNLPVANFFCDLVSGNVFFVGNSLYYALIIAYLPFTKFLKPLFKVSKN